MEKFEAKEVCIKHMYRYVRITMSDGSTYDGFIEHVDDEKVYIAVPVGHENMPYYHGANVSPYHHGGYISPYHHYGCWDPCYRYPAQDTRAFFPPFGFGFGSPFFGFPFGFRRFGLPLLGLTALSLLPFF
ncbi:hypothetical protein MUG84_06660 [Paenibacillus sp. KQZ6P-2]|uniref:Phosphatidylinositol kinase n=1 Tax=Paenibacillus mangrovi TaxID=2931978 RepID=A0A9X1WLE0_9BACL|nr:hypothetical protein [Paenibacillus mangrovi]